MSVEAMTTIKVPKRLRERISHDAARSGVSAAVYLSRLVDEEERRQRFAAVRSAYAADHDEAYDVETSEWDGTSADGLDS
jgi:hypothetical protein